MKKNYFLKIGILLIILTTITLIGFYLKDKTPDFSTSTPKNQVSYPLSPENLKDTDLDGLKNWEESLWGTDPENADTDKDGANDGDEVKQGRNPNIQGPNDKLENKFPIISELNYVDSQQPKTNNQIISKTEATIPVQNNISQKPLSELHRYGNTLGKILKNHITENSDESAIFNSIFSTSTVKSLAELKIVADRYILLAKNIENLETPEKISVLTSNLIQNYINQSKELEKLSVFSQSTDVPLEVWNSYNQSVMTTSQSLVSFMKFFKTENIIFQKDEDGYIFDFPN